MNNLRIKSKTAKFRKQNRKKNNSMDTSSDKLDVKEIVNVWKSPA